jgi:hypothetical protein
MTKSDRNSARQPNDSICQMRCKNDYAGREEYKIGDVRQAYGDRKALAALKSRGGNLGKPAGDDADQDERDEIDREAVDDPAEDTDHQRHGHGGEEGTSQEPARRSDAGPIDGAIGAQWRDL